MRRWHACFFLLILGLLCVALIVDKYALLKRVRFWETCRAVAVVGPDDNRTLLLQVREHWGTLAQRFSPNRVRLEAPLLPCVRDAHDFISECTVWVKNANGKFVSRSTRRGLALSPADGSRFREQERTTRRFEVETQAFIDRALLYEALYLLRFSLAENLGQRLNALRVLRELCHDWHHAVYLRDLGAIPLIVQALGDPNALIRVEAAQVLATASQNHFAVQQSIAAAAPELVRHAADATESLRVRSACLYAAVAMTHLYRIERGERTVSSTLQILEQAMDMCGLLCVPAGEQKVDMHRFVRRAFAFIRDLIRTRSHPTDASESPTLPHVLRRYLEQRSIQSRLERVLDSACLTTDAHSELAALLQILRAKRSPTHPKYLMIGAAKELSVPSESLPALQEPVEQRNLHGVA
ncbi:hypothetical protein F1559_000733 [Cyanidiococcus yangmingshanensis]|uniref:Uncharacterized protein n=1 Tax=Cyanidiococcus yangmingshanensis TaxID=2690220 RepID=A0A7J7IK34_9RHOD|nr:hypothetical protein F1559_000733 [Cyanidiococcus yangmingshanensis]